ncbi:MAG: HD domain-containing phosphohydrolase [Planctomycetaceae bacterium]
MSSSALDLSIDAGPPVVPPGGDSAAKGLLAVDADRLVVGSKLRFPVLDRHRMLLLAAEQTITPEFKRRLVEWGHSHVRINLEDASRLARLPTDDASGASTESQAAASRWAGESSFPHAAFVTNHGPAVRDSVRRHGRRRYDAAHRRELRGVGDASTRCLGAMIRQAVRGGEIAGDGVTRVAAGYLRHLTDDFESVLTTPFGSLPDQAIASHCLQMSLYGMAIAIEMGFNEQNVQRVGIAGLLHDWGMLRVPREIREAERRLDRIELLEIRKHPRYSLDLIERATTLPSLVPMIVYQVHERLDGRGYPRGRKGNAIHLFSRILHVADEFVSLTSPRPYRAPYSPYAAMESLLGRGTGRCLDPPVTRALLRVVSLFPIGSYVRLSDGSTARVLRGNGSLYDRPVVRLVADAAGKKVRETSDAGLIDLSDSPLRVAQALPTPGRREIAAPPHYRRLLLARQPLVGGKPLLPGHRRLRDPAEPPRPPYCAVKLDLAGASG